MDLIKGERGCLTDTTIDRLQNYAGVAAFIKLLWT